MDVIAMIVGFNLTKIVVDRNKPVRGKIKVNHDLRIVKVSKSQLPLKDKKEALVFDFEFEIKYDPGIGNILIGGNVLYFGSDAKKMNEICDNWEKKKKLPADVQQVMKDVSELMPNKAYELYNAEEIKAEKKLIEGGLVKIVEFKELAKLKAQGGKPVWDKWVADMKAKGIDGQAHLDEFLRLVKKYE